MALRKENKRHVRTLANGKKVLNRSFSERKKIVQQIEKGTLTIDEAMDQNQVANRGTIYRWIREHSKKKIKYQSKKRATTQQKIEAVIAYEQGRKDKFDICKELQITELTLKKWVNSYSCSIKEDKRLNEMSIISRDSSVEIKEYKKALEAARLKIMGLETMISIAENTFNIPIRKKCGTKQ